MLIYLIRNKLNGKVYIGQTTHSIETRWQQHISDAARNHKGCVNLYRAIRKHGAEAFEHQVLATASTKEELDATERRWIAHYGSMDRERGYNIREGGARGGFSKETRQQMSASAKRVRSLQWTPERRAAHSARMSGERNPFFGKQIPDEQRKRMLDGAAAFVKENPVTHSANCRRASRKSWAGLSESERAARVKPMHVARWKGGTHPNGIGGNYSESVLSYGKADEFGKSADSLTTIGAS